MEIGSGFWRPGKPIVLAPVRVPVFLTAYPFGVPSHPYPHASWTSETFSTICSNYVEALWLKDFIILVKFSTWKGYECCSVVHVRTDVSEERITFIFRVKNQQSKKQTYSRWLGWFSTLKMEVIPCSETSLHSQNTLRYVPNDSNIHNYRCGTSNIF
jgi:hypothetical protein